MAEHLESGRAAEQLACQFLQSEGLHHVASNYLCRYGEIDLIMAGRPRHTLSGGFRPGKRATPCLIIVEVRYRRSTRIMNPAASITQVKCRRIARATQHFLRTHDRWRGHPIRFDVVGLDGPLDNININWLRSAFTMDDLFND